MKGKKKAPKAKPLPKLGFAEGFALLFMLVSACLGMTWLLSFLLSSQQFHSHGIVSEIDPSARQITIAAPGNQKTSFKWKEETSFIKDGKDVFPGDLKIQTKVVVVYEGGLSQPYSAVRVKWKTELPNDQLKETQQGDT